jgi:putative membrane protein
MVAWGDMALGGWLWMTFWIVGLVAMVWLIVRGSNERPVEQDALEILRARFARGEISQDEYEQARDVLLATGTGSSR